MKILSHKTPFRLGVALAVLAMPIAAYAKDKSDNRSVDSTHQPVVSYTAYTFDVRSSRDGALPADEAQRLNDWFASINLSYGDNVAIVTDAGYYSPNLREDIGDLVARHGLLVAEDSSAAAGVAPEGAIRLIVRRATANVPGCPDWNSKGETSLHLSASSNYGCATNSNWAAMVASPEDLVRGQTTDSDLRTATSNLAISTYRDKKPTGSGDLKELTGGK